MKLSDPWLVPTRVVLADRLGLSRSYLWERLAIAGNAPNDTNGLDLALWYAAALAAGAPVLEPTEVFPEPARLVPKASGDSVPRLLGALHVRSRPFGGILADPSSFKAAVIQQAADALAEIGDWHVAAMVAALSPDERKGLGAAALADLTAWHGETAVLG